MSCNQSPQAVATGGPSQSNTGIGLQWVEICTYGVEAAEANTEDVRAMLLQQGALASGIPTIQCPPQGFQPGSRYTICPGCCETPQQQL